MQLSNVFHLRVIQLYNHSLIRHQIQIEATEAQYFLHHRVEQTVLGNTVMGIEEFGEKKENQLAQRVFFHPSYCGILYFRSISSGHAAKRRFEVYVKSLMRVVREEMGCGSIQEITLKFEKKRRKGHRKGFFLKQKRENHQVCFFFFHSKCLHKPPIFHLQHK